VHVVKNPKGIAAAGPIKRGVAEWPRLKERRNKCRFLPGRRGGRGGSDDDLPAPLKDCSLPDLDY